jgi:hypothetical protein
MKLGSLLKMGSIFNKRRGFKMAAEEVFGGDIFITEKGCGKVLTKI